MSRLTEKNSRIVLISNYSQTPSKEKIAEANRYNKLAELEDLEEELGCPLEVLFKLVKQNKFYYEQDDELHLIVCFEIELRNGKIYFDESWLDHDIELGDFGTIELPLSDYKKTWWLKDDRSE